MKSDQSITVKVLLVGSKFAGKTKLIIRFVEGCYAEDQFPTIGVDFVLNK